MKRSKRRTDTKCIMGSPQQPIAAGLREGLGSRDPALTISVIKKESFKRNLKTREGICLLNANWELVPQKRGLIEMQHIASAFKLINISTNK